MRTLKQSLLPAFLLLFFATSSFAQNHAEEAPVQLTWQMDMNTIHQRVKHHIFVIKNISQKSLDDKWCVYFSQMPKILKRTLNNKVTVEVINANYYRIKPTAEFKSLAAGDSLVVAYEVASAVPGISHMPEGAYWVQLKDRTEQQPLPVKLTVVTPEEKPETLNRYALQLYNANALLTPRLSLQTTDILPSVKHVEKGKEKTTLQIRRKVALTYDEGLDNEATLLKEKLTQLYGITVEEGAKPTISLRFFKENDGVEQPERYTLIVHPKGIEIKAATPHGVFNGTQTLLALLKGMPEQKQLTCQTITDYPDLSYRGMMLDVARNFTRLQDVKTLIDVLASYKINKFHFHLTDDEGWRLEIPGLEELTAVGGRRGHTHDEQESLYPCYDGNFDATAPTSGNGYYTRSEFVDLLRYAKQRHVDIIPEIEAPGHARAAIVAMKARYRKYVKTHPAKATEFLLSESEDSSVYVSAQSYTDNVMNVAMPSVYKFMTKVMTEVKNMYAEAGLTLTEVHLGGDEVPKGAWMGSPLCRALMKEKGFDNQHQLFEYFYLGMADCVKPLGMKLSGWQEIGLHNSSATDARLLPFVNRVYCWNTVPQWGGDEVPYTVANKGYGVVLCNVNNFYVDLMYSANFDERGLSWAGTVNEAKSFSALPFSIYRSARTDLKDNPIDIDSVEVGKLPLNPDAYRHIHGVQAQLFSETIRSFDDVTAYVFPKILGLVERGWNAHPHWEQLRGEAEAKAFHRDLSLFYNKLSEKELPYLQQLSLNIRIPNPGLKLDNGFLYANSPLSGSEIRYTTDGTEPTISSPLWQKGVACDAPVIKAKTFYRGCVSTTTIIKQQ